jgi:hypothetical protein
VEKKVLACFGSGNVESWWEGGSGVQQLPAHVNGRVAMLSKSKTITLAIAAIAFLAGVALGIGIMILVGVCLAHTGRDFETIRYAYDSSGGKTVFHTPKFTFVFEGLDLHGRGSGGMTVSGEYGIIPAFWRLNYGYTTGQSGKCICFYDPVNGIATIDFYGNVFTIRREPPSWKSVLSIRTTTVNLDKEPPVLIVDPSGAARVADAKEAKAIVDSLEKWLLTFGPSPHPVPIPPGEARALP